MVGASATDLQLALFVPYVAVTNPLRSETPRFVFFSYGHQTFSSGNHLGKSEGAYLQSPRRKGDLTPRKEPAGPAVAAATHASQIKATRIFGQASEVPGSCSGSRTSGLGWSVVSVVVFTALSALLGGPDTATSTKEAATKPPWNQGTPMEPGEPTGNY